MGMALGTDYRRLQDHGFFAKYYDPQLAHQKDLILAAKDSYQFLKKMGTTPLPDEVEDLLEIDLSFRKAYEDLIRDLAKSSGPKLDDGFWKDVFLPSVARFLVDNEWDDIVS